MQLKVSLQVCFLVANDKKLVNKQFYLKRRAELIPSISSGKTLGLKFQAHLNKSSLRRILWERASCPISRPSCYSPQPRSQHTSLEGLISPASLYSHVDRNSKGYLSAGKLHSDSKSSISSTSWPLCIIYCRMVFLTVSSYQFTLVSVVNRLKWPLNTYVSSQKTSGDCIPAD